MWEGSQAHNVEGKEWTKTSKESWPCRRRARAVEGRGWFGCSARCRPSRSEAGSHFLLRVNDSVPRKWAAQVTRSAVFLFFSFRTFSCFSFFLAGDRNITQNGLISWPDLESKGKLKAASQPLLRFLLPSWMLTANLHRRWPEHGAKPITVGQNGQETVANCCSSADGKMQTFVSFTGTDSEHLFFKYIAVLETKKETMSTRKVSIFKPLVSSKAQKQQSGAH